MVRLGDRDERILRHVARYRLSTPEVIYRLYFEPEGATLEATKSTLRRLWKDSERAYLGSQNLYGSGREVYYHLTPHGAAYLRFADPEKVGHGFDDATTRAKHLGCLLFGCGKMPRPKFTQEEFQACFPGVLEPGTDFYARFFSDAYYLDDADGVRRLGRVLVDTGGNTKHVLQRAVDEARRTLPRFVEAGRFALAFVLPTDAKMRNVRNYLRQVPLEPVVPVTFDVQPNLVKLLQTGLS